MEGLNNGNHFTSPLILWLGGLKLLTMAYTVDLNTSGQRWTYSTYMNGSLTPYVSFYWGPTRTTWDLAGGSILVVVDGTKVTYHSSV
jgi:hypothetical protein